MQAERDLLSPAGIPDRPWFRHLIYAPLPSYEAETLPGIREAVMAGDTARARAQAEVLAAALARAVKLLEEGASR
jgi:N-acetylated-alpha-linked acidic dipeptidase